MGWRNSFFWNAGGTTWWLWRSWYELLFASWSAYVYVWRYLLLQRNLFPSINCCWSCSPWFLSYGGGRSNRNSRCSLIRIFQHIYWKMPNFLSVQLVTISSGWCGEGFHSFFIYKNGIKKLNIPISSPFVNIMIPIIPIQKSKRNNWFDSLAVYFPKLKVSTGVPVPIFVRNSACQI